MCIYIYIYYVYVDICTQGEPLVRIPLYTTPSPPTKSLGFEGFDSRRLLILRDGNYHIHIIV